MDDQRDRGSAVENLAQEAAEDVVEGRVATAEEEENPAPLSRRETLKLASAAVALAAGLGIPLRALAEAPESAAELMIKWYWARQPDQKEGGTLLHTQEVAERTARMLLSGEPGALQIKWYAVDDRRSALLGQHALPSELQIKIEYALR